MSRPRWTIAGAVLGLALVLGYAAFSLVETERKALAAAEAMGRALLVSVSAGVEKSLQATRAVEGLLSDRLLTLGRDLDHELAGSPGREEAVLSRFTARHRVKSALLLDGDFGVRVRANLAGPAPAGVPSPVSRERLDPMVAEDLLRKVRAAGLGEREYVVVFGENPFGTRVDFLVGLRLPEAGGFLLLRHDAEELRSFRRRAGVDRLLSEAADSDAISFLVIEDERGRVLAASDPALLSEARAEDAPRSFREGGVLDVRIAADWEGFPPATLRVGLVADPVRAVIARGRRSVFLFTGIVLVVAAGAAAGLWLAIRARRRREAALEKELRDRERAVSMGRLAAGIAHEIRGPLNAMGMAAQRLTRALRADAPDLADVGGIAASIRREVDRVDGTVSEFLALGRPQPLEIQPVDLRRLLDEIVRDEDPRATVTGPEAGCEVRLDPGEIRKAIGNLLRNARQAAGEGPVVVAGRRVGGETEIEVRDGGPGIPAEERDRVFEHFYTGRPDGTGLGLAIVKSVVDRHGGRIDVGDAPEGGARFLVRLPNAK